MSGVKSDSGVLSDWAMHGIKYRSLVCLSTRHGCAVLLHGVGSYGTCK